ncbi:MAG: DUF2804 family protein, partial [Clostridia bacterium]|nr:DUF2804 family protein [Clostridia bacterium]
IIYNNSYACEIIILSSAFYRNLHIRFFDFTKLDPYEYEENKKVGPNGFSLSILDKKGKVEFKDKNSYVNLTAIPNAKIIKALIFDQKDFNKNGKFFANIWLNEANKSDCVLIIPMSKKRYEFILSQSINPIFANGVVRFDDIEADFENENSFAYYERVRSCFNFKKVKNTTIYRCFFSTFLDGTPLGFNVSRADKDFSENNNIITYNKTVYKLDRIRVKKNKQDMKAWTIYSPDGDVKLRFRPFYKKECTTKIGRNHLNEVKFFGYFFGDIRIENDVIHIEKIVGVIEEKRF